MEQASLTTSQQSSGGRHLAPADPIFPFRTVVWECTAAGWRVLCVFEMSTLEAAEFAGMEMCTEPYEPGVTAMHYVIGEVANG